MLRSTPGLSKGRAVALACIQNRTSQMVSTYAAVWQAFVAKKEAEAVSASLWPLTTEIDEHPAGALAIGNDWTRRMFDGDFYVSAPTAPDVPSTSLVFVQSRDGNTGASNPSTLGGGDTDKHLIYEGLSRVAADAVMAGAKTIRGGRIVLSAWHPELVALRARLGLPRHPIQIVATLRGMPFDGSLLLNVPDLRVVLLTIPSWLALMHDQLVSRPWVTPVLMDTPDDLAGAFRQLRRLGIERISCIGGRTLARQLIDAGLIHELNLTTSAKAAGEPDTPLYPTPIEAPVIVRKRGTGPEAGIVFEQLNLGGWRPSTRPSSPT
jgi:riboflavin biosynthesis pyrimidine reductase